MAKYTSPWAAPAPVTSSSFKNPDHFIPIKGRAGRVYCKICTPPGHAHGQAMTLAAAQRHERESARHKDKIAEAALWDWSHQHEPDWITPNVPQGESAWELDPLPTDRIVAYVQFWLEGIEAGERDEELPRLERFISEFDKAYQEENWGLEFEDWDDEQEEEWPAQEYDGDRDYWYRGYEEGYEATAWVSSAHPSEIARIAAAAKMWMEEPDPKQGWDVYDESATPWGAPPDPAPEQPEQPADVGPTQEESATAAQLEPEKIPTQEPESTAPQEPGSLAPGEPQEPAKVGSPGSEKPASQGSKRRRRQRKRGRGRGRGQGQQAGQGKDGHVLDNATQRVEAQRNRRSKMY
ncbi:hypothetical protein BV20DRAFT_960552 [Pilatotrama ljubarskyi]|nr:hypothetical protein BV20DRAFT_960552 [Pilatotrama ljubarskyi]